MPLKISSITIAKNESSNIERCINSLLPVADEIIVLVDKETTDDTMEKVQKYPGVIYEYISWQGYSATKKYGLTKTTNNWILWIDADEEITTELQKELLDFKNSTPDHDVYSVPRKAYFLGKWIKHCGWYPGRVNRLFNKQKASFNNNQVHEDLQFSGTVGKMNYDLNHYTDPNIEHYYNKFNIYTTLAAEELHKKHTDFGLSDVLLRPLFLWFKMYILKKGFLDGMHGFVLSVFSANYVFTKYAKLWEYKLRKQK